MVQAFAAVFHLDSNCRNDDVENQQLIFFAAL
jgi:hypothetical protein